MKKWERPTRAEILLDNLEFNINQIRNKFPDKKILVPVKANAYGHGIIGVSKFLQDILNIDFLGVAIISEGIKLRENGITKPILVFGALLEEDIPYIFEYNLTPTITSYEIAKKLNSYNKKIKVHINIDTGMGRIGIKHEEAISIIAKISKLENIIIEGIYTHFPISDVKDKTFTLKQIEIFRNIINNTNLSPKYIHCENSGAIIDLNLDFFNLIRPGIMTYGLYPSDEVDKNFELKQVMRLVTKIIHKKTVKKGDSVSYGRTFLATKDTIIGTIPIGYGDGYNRKLSNRGYAIIGNKKYKIAGRVTMDQIMLNLENDDFINIGDDVILYGESNNQTILIADIAKMLDTITYEVTCWISERVPRIFLYKGEKWVKNNISTHLFC